MLRKAHEIIGSELPIFKNKGEDQYIFEEISAMENNLNDFTEVGFIEVLKGDQTFYQKVYIKKG